MANTIWKEGARRGIAYVEDKETAEQIMQIAGRRRAADAKRAASLEAVQESALNGAMAIYTDKIGRPFAWQIPFDLGQWDKVAAAVDSSL